MSIKQDAVVKSYFIINSAQPWSHFNGLRTFVCMDTIGLKLNNLTIQFRGIAGR